MKREISFNVVKTVSIVIALSICVFPSEILAQWQNALFGDGCSNFDSAFNPDLACDGSIGLTCQGGSEATLRCSCYEPFGYDPVSEQCRRRVGNTCAAYWNLTVYNLRPWNLKCEQNADCVARGAGRAGRDDGLCTCRPGFGRSGPQEPNCRQVGGRRRRGH